MIIVRNAVESWCQKMWQTNEPYYSERTKLKMLKDATKEQLIEFLVMVTRRTEDGK